MSLRSPVPTAALGFVAALWTFAPPSDGAVITQTATDTGSQTGWTEGARWSDGQPPSAGNDYLTPAPYWFRTPGTSDVQPFAGDSLTIQGTLIVRHVGSATIGDLRLDGGGMLHGIANRTITLAGNINLMQTAVMDPHLADRTIVLESTISGVGGLTLAPGTIVTSTAPNGTLVLSGNNTYNGATAVNGGTLRLANSHALQNSTLTTGGVEFDRSVSGNAFTLGGLAGIGNIVLENNAATPAPVTLTVGNNNADTEYRGVLSGTGSLRKIGEGTLILTGDNTYAGTTTVSDGTLQVGDGGNTGTLGHGAVVNNATLVLNRNNPWHLTNRISGSGNLIKQGDGTLTLSNANTYGGSTIIEAGTLQLGAAGIGAPVGFWEMSEGSGATIYNAIAGSPDGTLYNSPTWVEGPGGPGSYGVYFDGVNQYGEIIPDAALNAIGSGAFTVGAWVRSDTAGTWLRTLVTKFGDTGINNFWGLGWIDPNELGFVIRDNQSPRNELKLKAPTGWGLDNEWHHIVGVRDGAGQVHLYLDGVWFATTTDFVGDASNDRPIQLARHHGPDYCVETSIAGVGIWDYALGRDDVAQLYTRGLAPRGGSLPANTALRIAAGGTFDLNGIDQTVGSLADHNGGGTVMLGGATLTTGGDDSSTTFSGTLAGDGALVKTGAGTLTLSGESTYTGGTAVNAGTLLVHTTSGSGTGTGPVTVAPDAMLGGSGRVGGSTTIESGGILAPGPGLETLTFLNDLALQAGAMVQWEFLEAGTPGEQYDSIAGTKLILPEAGTVGLDIIALGGHSLSAGDRFTLFDGDEVYHGETLLSFGDDVSDLFSITDNIDWWGTWEVTADRLAAGSLILTAVPEPGAWMLLFWAMTVGLLLRRR